MSEGAGTAFALSGAGHLLLAFALSWVVWSAAPQESVSTSVAVVFEAPADQVATPAPPQAAAAVAVEPSQPEPPQPEPPADPAPDRAEAVPSVPLLEPAPEPVPEVLPPPSTPQQPTSQPVPVPRAKPPTRQLAVRPQAAKPASQRPGPITAQPADAVPNAPASEPTPQPAQASAAASGWNTLFSAWLAARKTYPEAARRHGEQGNVTLHFRVATDGRVLEVALVTGSGSPVLDEAARSLLRDAKVPPPQAEISRTVRLRYRLDD